jgi:cellulose synthase (UDP-forming)
MVAIAGKPDDDAVPAQGPKGPLQQRRSTDPSSNNMMQTENTPIPSASSPARDLEASPSLQHASVGVLSRSQKSQHFVLALIWLAVTTTFWSWWLSHSARSTPWLYWVQTVMLLYQTTVLPSLYWVFVLKMRKPVEVLAPANMRVAMITLCVPSSESSEVIREQLKALQRVGYPHDSWILDEGGSPEVEGLARAYGVMYFSRAGVSRWNQSGPPFQRKTKAGNVNAWLDHITGLGADYGVFVQLDIDHHPRAYYLDRVLGYFQDPKIAWVQAPSVCGNLENWAARGLAEQELVFQGPLQMGFYGATQTPFIIGSHTAYRTAAIREIGGFQPTRAEDHLDTVVLSARGYRGVFVPEVIAVGSGPTDFVTYLRQQFAWAYSMGGIFFRQMPKLVRRYSFGQAFQFLFCQSWYTLWALSLALLWLLPSVALLTHHPIASVAVGEFLLYFLPVPIVSTLMWAWTHRWFQPAGVKLSWRGMVLEIARWPVVLWAIINVIFGVRHSYMVTPKGGAGQKGPRAFSVYVPYMLLTALPLAAMWLFYHTAGTGNMRGYYGLALINAVFGLVLLQVILLFDIRDLAVRDGVWRAMRERAWILLCVLGLLLGFADAVAMVWHPMLEALR